MPTLDEGFGDCRDYTYITQNKLEWADAMAESKLDRLRGNMERRRLDVCQPNRQ